jgi:hypothetical protein
MMENSEKTQLAMIVWQSLVSLKGGHAGEIQMGNLAMSLNIMLVISERIKHSGRVESILNQSLNALLDIKARKVKRGTFIATGDELKVIGEMCELNEEFLNNITAAELLGAQREVHRRREAGIVY